MPGGRPSKFDSLDQRQIETLVKKGFTDVELSDFFGITEQTLNNYKKKHTAFFESLKRWKETPDENVKKALYERAIGYSHPEDKVFVNNGNTIVVPTIKHYPPETAACIFWLKNRQPDRWKDKHDIESEGPLKIEVLRYSANNTD